VGRDEDLEPMGFRCLEDPVYVLDGFVFRDALANDPPGQALLAEHLILWIDEDDRSVVLAYVHRASPNA